MNCAPRFYILLFSLLVFCYSSKKNKRKPKTEIATGQKRKRWESLCIYQNEKGKIDRQSSLLEEILVKKREL